MGACGEQEEEHTTGATSQHDGRALHRRLSAGLFLMASAVYLLLMSGHIYARDEETLFQMTQNIARSGTPRVSPEAWGIVESGLPAKNGLVATRYAPGQPLLAVPLYWMGAAVGHLGGAAYAHYLSRFVLLSFNGFVTGATVALLFRFALALGFGPPVGVALALCYGGASYALIQTRTFFAEPLTTLLVFLSFFLIHEACTREDDGWRRDLLLAASGFVIVAALSVKIHAALFLPALALYLALATVPSMPMLPDQAGWRMLIRRGGIWMAGMTLPVVALMVYNARLYGSPLTTGYGESPNIFTTPIHVGVYGLLLSSGKGLLWYAPPILFAVIGLPRFLRSFPRLGIAILVAGATNVVFYARLRFWHGEGSWGPRYLLMVLPWLMLPALPTLEWLLRPSHAWRVVLARVGAVLIVLAGVLVQTMAIAVSFDVPVLTTEEHARFFTPGQSPIVVAARTASDRLHYWWRDVHPRPNTLLLRDGWYPSEGDAGALFPRWTGETAVTTIHATSGAAIHVKLTYFDHRPVAMRATPTPVTVALGTTPLTPVDTLPIAPANEGFILAYDISPDLLQRAGDRLTVSAPIWNPATMQVSPRDEDLGLFVNNLEVWANGVPLTVWRTTVIPGVPASPRQIWLWANYPEYPHTLDWWPVLLRDARLPAPLKVAVTAGMLGILALLLTGGLLCFLRATARTRKMAAPSATRTLAGV